MVFRVPLSISTDLIAVDFSTGGDLFVSAGVTIASIFDVSVRLGRSDQDVIVHGTVIGQIGISDFGTTPAVGALVTIGDTGRVVGTNGSAIYLNGSGSSVVNNGVIESFNAFSYVVQLGLSAVNPTGSVANAGLIEGTKGILVFGSGGTSFRLENSGTIDVGEFAFRNLSFAADTIVNTGRMIGDVELGAGNDRFDGRGGRLDGELFGDAGRDRLISGSDGDRLHGGEGRDVLTGGGGADRFVFDVTPGRANADDITDFGGADRILLQDTNFRVLPQGALAAGAFRANASGLAGDGNDRVIYETDTGWLRYDVDGRGGADSFRFAHLDANLAINAGDFFVI